MHIAVESNLGRQTPNTGCRRVLQDVDGECNWSFERIVAGFDEYRCSDRVDEHLRRNLIRDLIWNK